jgi:hypothetical protein
MRRVRFSWRSHRRHELVAWKVFSPFGKSHFHALRNPSTRISRTRAQTPQTVLYLAA